MGPFCRDNCNDTSYIDFELLTLQTPKRGDIELPRPQPVGAGPRVRQAPSLRWRSGAQYRGNSPTPSGSTPFVEKP